MAAPIVKTAAAADEAAAIDVLVLAFAADPVVRWTWRDPGVYLASFPAHLLLILAQHAALQH